MGARRWEPLAIAIGGLLLAILSYGMTQGILGNLTYGSGLISAGLAVVHWFTASDPRVQKSR
jgi:hypothetical protein